MSVYYTRDFTVNLDFLEELTSELLGRFTWLGTMHLGPDSPAKPHLCYIII